MSQFTENEWDKIFLELEKNPAKYGFPERRYGSVLLGSFNIRKLGSTRNRSPKTWDFLAKVCRQFDLLSIQEIMDNLEGFQRLMSMLGPEFGMIVSDKTGVFPGKKGLGERLGFVFRWSVVQRADVVSDLSYDRSIVLNLLAKNIDEIAKVMKNYSIKLMEYEEGKRSKPRNPKMPVFLTFIRQPYIVAFRIVGNPGTKPYEFMAVNAHLYYGKYITDRRQEFNALLEWIIGRVKENDRAYFPNFILLGDLNLDFDSPESDYERIKKYMKAFNNNAGEEVNVNFPFLNKHEGENEVYRTTAKAKMDETYDQIGLFFRDTRFPTYDKNPKMNSTAPRGPDYGMFNFVNLFSTALNGKPFKSLSKKQRKDFLRRFDHKVSDHMPIWLRLSLPDK